MGCCFLSHYSAYSVNRGNSVFHFAVRESSLNIEFGPLPLFVANARTARGPVNQEALRSMGGDTRTSGEVGFFSKGKLILVVHPFDRERALRAGDSRSSVTESASSSVAQQCFCDIVYLTRLR